MRNCSIKRLSPLSNDCGYHLSWVADKDNVDRLLASEIAYGNIGHLYGCYGNPAPKQVKNDVLKSYFMIQQLQQKYANETVANIRYADADGELLSTEEAIARDALDNNQVYVKYNNGLELYVNRNREKIWNVKLAGQDYSLPPHGYVARLGDELLVYSALINGKRANLSRGPDYTYVDGRGQQVDFGCVVAADSYVIKPRSDNAVLLIPTPFAQAEKLSIQLDQIPGGHGLAPAVAALSITPLTRDGKSLKTIGAEVKNAKALVEINPEAFSYVLKWNEQN